MAQYTCRKIDSTTYDDFSARHPQGNFQQSSGMNNVRMQSGIIVEYLGFFEEERLAAACALEIHRSRLSTFAEVHDGPLCDFDNAELTEFVFAELKKRAHDAKAAQLIITPELPYMYRDIAGNELPSSDEPWPANTPEDLPREANTSAFDNIVQCGFEHDGFARDYTAVPRWRFVKDLSGCKNEQDLLNTYAKNHKRNVRIAHNSCVAVERIGREQLGVFHDICEMSSERQGFDNRPLEYFELLYDCLGDKAEFYVAYIDAVAFLKSWEDKRDGFLAEIERLKELEEKKGPLSPKNQKKLNDQQSKYEASLKRVDKAREYLEADGERIPAAAAMFVFHPRECVYLFSGSNATYAKFYAATAIQHHIMTECIERGLTRYNFYGINGIFDDPNDPGRGLLEFKQGFGGYVEEMMGSFTMTVKPMAFAVKKLAHKLLDRS